MWDAEPLWQWWQAEMDAIAATRTAPEVDDGEVRRKGAALRHGLTRIGWEMKRLGQQAQQARRQPRGRRRR
jgi:hypothetical protein